jgi:hypothetical protein
MTDPDVVTELGFFIEVISPHEHTKLQVIEKEVVRNSTQSGSEFIPT